VEAVRKAVQRVKQKGVKERGMMRMARSWVVVEVGEEQQLVMLGLPPVLQLALQDFGRRHL
jgi:hypothetical protein